MKNKKIPIIDLFAGPGGLGEGFSSLVNNFDIKLSIEKDENAHQTLELRSFIRQFKKVNIQSRQKLLKKRPGCANSETPTSQQT
jgi:DNA (cytosine-5)-methyltransferase 1